MHCSTIRTIFIAFFITSIKLLRSEDLLPGLERYDKVRVNERNYEKVRNLHLNWHGAAIKALIGQLGKELYQKLPPKQKVVLAKCLDQIDDKKDFIISSKCLVKSRRKLLHENGLFRIPMKKENIQTKLEPDYGEVHSEESKNYKNVFRWKRSFGLRHRIRAQKRRQKNKYRMRHIMTGGTRQKDYVNLKSIELSREVEPVRKQKKNDWKVKQSASIPNLPNESDKSLIARVANLISNFASSKNSTFENSTTNDQIGKIKWANAYKKLLEVKQKNDEHKKSPGARVYDFRMYDLVLEKDQPSMSAKQRKSPQGLMEMAFEIINGMSGKENSKKRHDSNINILSPRFAPIMPDKAQASNIQLSPTIFALYDNDDVTETNEETIKDKYEDLASQYDGIRDRKLASNKRGTESALVENAQKNNISAPDLQNIASVPKLLKASGVSKRDRETVLELLMDVSGAAKHIDDALDIFKNLNFFDIEDEIFESHDHIEKAYGNLKDSLQSEQNSQLNQRGFTFLKKKQVERLLRDQSFDLSKNDLGIDRHPHFESTEEFEESLWKRIECIAENIPDGHCTDGFFNNFFTHNDSMTELYRHKRSLQNASILEPTVLAPFMFTPILGLSVLGPVVLSPSLFSPLILNPGVLSPYVLSPAIGMPFILSPYLLTPYVLSPLVMAPFILNPYVLSPNVLNPYLLSPLILSPLVLCPDVLSPMALGGSILSPSVASPAILTDTALMANWLSPSFLSR